MIVLKKLYRSGVWNTNRSVMSTTITIAVLSQVSFVMDVVLWLEFALLLLRGEEVFVKKYERQIQKIGPENGHIKIIEKI